MNNTLTEVKKKIKEVVSKDCLIRTVDVYAEAFGEGYDVYVDLMYWNPSKGIESNFFKLSDEEKEYQAKSRMKRVTESLEKISDKANNIGFTSYQ